MRESNIELVVFDLGRVMIRLCGGWEDACRRAGVPVPANLHEPVVQQAIKHAGYLHETGRLSDAEFARRTGEIVGLLPAQVQAVSHAWLDGPFPGWDALIDRVHAAGARTACLSNTNAAHWKIMTTPGANFLPLERLHFRIASHLVGAYKPEPAIYHALESASGVAPERIIFFDDLPVNCAGAETRGWRAQIITYPGDPVQQVRECLMRNGLFSQP